jgi:hypothetical protein
LEQIARIKRLNIVDAKKLLWCYLSLKERNKLEREKDPSISTPGDIIDKILAVSPLLARLATFLKPSS